MCTCDPLQSYEYFLFVTKRQHPEQYPINPIAVTHQHFYFSFVYYLTVCGCVRVGVCFCDNIENVIEQHQGEAEGQSIKRERKRPRLILDIGMGACVCYNIENVKE